MTDEMTTSRRFMLGRSERFMPIMTRAIYVNNPFEYSYISVRMTSDELSEDAALWKIHKKAMRAKEERLKNEMMTTYLYRRDGSMWIPDIYRKILGFLSIDSMRSLYVVQQQDNLDWCRPDHNKFVKDDKHQHNPRYNLWALKRLAKPLKITYVEYFIRAHLSHRKNIVLKYRRTMKQMKIAALIQLMVENTPPIKYYANGIRIMPVSRVMPFRQTSLKDTQIYMLMPDVSHRKTCVCLSSLNDTQIYMLLRYVSLRKRYTKALIERDQRTRDIDGMDRNGRDSDGRVQPNSRYLEKKMLNLWHDRGHHIIAGFYIMNWAEPTTHELMRERMPSNRRNPCPSCGGFHCS